MLLLNKCLYYFPLEIYLRNKLVKRWSELKREEMVEKERMTLQSFTGRGVSVAEERVIINHSCEEFVSAI